MELQQELSKSSLKVSENLGENLTSIMASADQHNIPAFTKLFYEEQQKYIKYSSQGIGYHSMIIRFCLSSQHQHMMILDMMKNLVLAFLSFQADIALGIIKTILDQREVSTKTF